VQRFDRAVHAVLHVFDDVVDHLRNL